MPLGETTDLSPFETPNVDTLLPGERGHRAVLSFGHLDTEVQGLVPLDDDVQIAGASSDLTVVNLADGPGGRKVGDTIAFRPSYGALVRMMQNQYMAKTVSPPLSEYQRSGPSVPLRAVHSSARIARSSQQPPTPEQMEAR